MRVKADEFSVVRNVKYDTIVATGEYNWCVKEANFWNEVGDCSDYVAELWRDSETS